MTAKKVTIFNRTKALELRHCAKYRWPLFVVWSQITKILEQCPMWKNIWKWLPVHPFWGGHCRFNTMTSQGDCAKWHDEERCPLPFHLGTSRICAWPPFLLSKHHCLLQLLLHCYADDTQLYPWTFQQYEYFYFWYNKYILLITLMYLYLSNIFNRLLSNVVFLHYSIA